MQNQTQDKYVNVADNASIIQHNGLPFLQTIFIYHMYP